MTHPPPRVSPPRLPPAGDQGEREPWRARWLQVAGRSGDPAIAAALEARLDDPADRELMAAVVAMSPFLADCLLGEPSLLLAYRDAGPEALVAAELRAIDELPFDRNRMLPGLRRAKRRIATTIGLADLEGAFDLDQVTSGLTRLADRATEAVLGTFLVEAARRGEIELADPERPTRDCGIFVVGMGKLGADELN